jgi:hypothetical protein
LLVDEVREELAFLWEEYARADLSTLSPAAQRLREVLIQSFEEEAGDAS